MPDDNQARTAAFRSTAQKLANVRSHLRCATITITNSDAHATDDDISHAETTLRGVMADLDRIADEFDEFESSHLLAPAVAPAN